MSRSIGLALAAALCMGGLALRWSVPRAADSPNGPPLAELAATPLASAAHSPDPADTIPLIRVRLKGTGTTQSAPRTLRIDGPYLVTELDGWRVQAQGGKLPAAELGGDDAGLMIGNQRFATRRLQIKVILDGTLWIDGHRYRGDLRLLAEPEGGLALVNVLDLEAYLASVLPSEMPNAFPAAARQAQAIAARTYALVQIKNSRAGRDFDLDDSTASQRYLGMEYIDAQGRRLAVESDSSRNIIDRTRHMVLLYGGRLFCTYYSAVCGGHTTSGPAVFGNAAPPLVGVPCEHCQAGPHYRWDVAATAAEVQAKIDAHLAGSGRRLGTLQAIRVDDPGGGMPPEVELVGSEGEYRFPAAEFRRRISTAWPSGLLLTAKLQGDQVLIAGRGWGHGMGLCQHGARALAAEGRTSSEILEFYYPGSQLAKVR